MKDFNSSKDSKRPSASFVVGAVALLFLIVGYQAALFIWYRKQGFGVQKGKRFGQQLIPQELGALSSGRADQEKLHSKKI